MLVDVQIARDRHVHVDQRVTGQLLQHVVEKPDAGRDPVRPGAVEIERDVDPRLGGVAGEGCGAHRAPVHSASVVARNLALRRGGQS